MKSKLLGILGWLIVLSLLISCTSTGNTSVSTSATKNQAISKVVVYKVIREEIQYSDGVMAGYTLYQYDTKGNLILEQQFNGKKSLVLKKTGEIKANGKQLVVTIANPSGELQGISVKDFDNTGLLIKETLLNAQNQIQSSSEFIYDKLRNLTTWITRGQGQSIIAQINYILKDSLTIGIEIQDSTGQSIKKFTQTFNSDGLITTKVEKDAEGKLISTINYSYANGKLAKEEYLNAEGILQRTVAYVYNDVGQPNRIQFFDRKGKLMESRIQEFQAFTQSE